MDGRSARDPAKQERIEAELKSLPKSTMYEEQVDRIRSGQYRINRTTLRKNRANLEKKHRALTEKIVSGKSIQVQGNKAKEAKAGILLKIMEDETDVESNIPKAVAAPVAAPVAPAPVAPVPTAPTAPTAPVPAAPAPTIRRRADTPIPRDMTRISAVPPRVTAPPTLRAPSPPRVPSPSVTAPPTLRAPSPPRVPSPTVRAPSPPRVPSPTVKPPSPPIKIPTEDETKKDILETDLQTKNDLAHRIKECEDSCKQLKKQLNVIKSAERFDYELSYDQEVPKLITLLEKVVLNPIVTWKENIEALINIPNSLEGSNRLKGGDYFEALFQLAFSLKFIPEISNFIMKAGSKELTPVEFLYTKPVKNSGGAEHGIVDIHFSTNGAPGTVSTKYQCGEIVKDIDIYGIHYFISAKNYYKEKSSSSYDIDEICNEIKLQLPHIKNPHVCVACRDKEVFYKKLDRMKTERLKLSINRVFGMKELLEFFETYRNNFFSNLDSLELDKIHAALPPRQKELKLPLSLYFHQELIINAVYERYTTVSKENSHYTCIGVLPRGGKSYIAGGIMKKFDYNKPKFAVLFISSAINETMSQFEDDLINKFSDFNDYKFINLRNEPGTGATAGRSFTVKYASKDKLFVFVSRELITGKENENEDLVDDSKVPQNLQKVFKRLDPNLKFDLIFFDEAHKGGITDKTKDALKTVSKGTTPVILLTATYKKLLDSQRGHINEQEDLFIWDLDDVRTMRKLVRETPETIESFYTGESGKKYDMFERYSEQKIKSIISRRIQLGETLESIAAPYLQFPEPFFISTTFTPEMHAKLPIGFSMKQCFELNQDTAKILEDQTNFQNWHTLFKNTSDITTLRAILTPRDIGDETVSFNDPKLEKHKLLNRIFSIASRDSINARPSEGKPFSILMFLPVGTGNSLVGHISRAWASKLHQDRFWREKFVFVVLSSLNLPDIPKAATAMAVRDPEESTMSGGSQLVCVNNGYCDIEKVAGTDLKSRIQTIEREALRDGKGLVIITGKRATMGISLPCVDVVCLFDEDKEADEIIQKMYRALTDSPNKKFGFVIDINPVRIIKAQYEYKDIKNATRKTTDTVESVKALVTSVAEAGLWDTDAWAVAEDTGKGEMMKKIRDDMLNKLTGDEFKKYEADITAKVPDILNGLLDLTAKREITKILSGVHIASVCEASKVLQDKTMGEKTAVTETVPETLAEDEEETNEKKKKVKSEEEIIKENMKKIPKFLKHIINMLILRDEDKVSSSDTTLESILAKYESDKVLMAGKPLDCGCSQSNNLYLRVYCGIMSFIGNSENTQIFLDRAVPFLQYPKIFIIYKNYVESFMAAMERVPSVQSGGKSESSQKRYNSILQVIDDHLIPDECAKKERGEVFTPPNLVREMLFGLRKSALEKGVNEIWGINKEGNFFDEGESDRVGGLPLEVWKNPKSTFLDPANGIGNFPIIAYYMLDYHLRAKMKDDDERRKHIIEKMLFMIEIDKGNVETSKGLFKKIHPKAKANILCADTLKVTDEGLQKAFALNTFDVVMGNPPFNPPKTATGSSGNSIWQNFVMKSFSLQATKGYLCLVHPPGWKKPTDEDYKSEKFLSGNYTGQIRQGQVWQVLKDAGIFKFIYTNEQKSKTLDTEFLQHFPAVDYYVYQKGGDKTTCDTKNIFLGEITMSKGVRLNYNLKYLPNLITKQTQDILHKITSKDGDKPDFGRGIDERGITWTGKTIDWLYDSNKSGFQYKKHGINALTKSGEAKDTVNINKVVVNFGGGINAYNVKYLSNSDEVGVLDKTMYYKVDSDKQGKNIESFYKSDIVKFIFLITQYASGAITQNEPIVANSITIPPEGITDYYKFFGIEEHKKYIEDILAHYEKFKAPKRGAKTAKAKGGSMKPHRFTRRKSRN